MGCSMLSIYTNEEFGTDKCVLFMECPHIRVYRIGSTVYEEVLSLLIVFHLCSEVERVDWMEGLTVQKDLMSFDDENDTVLAWGRQ